MPRDSNNVYTLPEAPFQPNTVAQPGAVNNNFSDVAGALTDSLTRAETTAFTRGLLDDADAAAARNTLDVPRRRDVGSEWLATITPAVGTFVEFAFPTAFQSVDVDLVSVRPDATAALFFHVSNDGINWYTGPTNYLTGVFGSNATAAGVLGSAGQLSFGVLASAGFLTGRATFSRSGEANRPVQCNCTVNGPRNGGTWDGATYFTIGPFDGVASHIRMFWLGQAWTAEGRIIVRGVRG
ncbi:MAG TPA: hypothetical protein VGN96_00245 [Roseococcus sp.]|jgi:hypothetical protein|nr:hypothetical protein [Roseococcus sp.]